MRKSLILATLCTLISTSALAQIYECTDSRGNHSYSEVPKGKNCHSVSNLGGNFSTTSAYKPAVATPDTNSKDADSAARNQPDQAAISAARKNLADAKKALEDGKKIRMGNERNYVRYQERIKGLEDAVKSRQQDLDKALNGK
ncbi:MULTISPECIES: DUF4124 domain-containing protein [Snodgrassella]|uniref:DUF4124 domain-containing protein n=1 Tax=Snodgrassella TaxID=1193515 RepID=UPI000997532E|nr:MULTISPECIES: DUF4124 domain-containing protein [Snodgrassella]MBI0098402.1 DUF4124 domain-containing protein [Snodgrassella sp. W8134]MBI0102193.1 DUF4124 domain-containing protein [Snodgrassella sp. W8135]MBI0164312.1 DUF4124 domain-containing protein [Snodgrassella sp. M0351]OOX79423.1 hypothetical protein BGH94_04300 [Snodgrassella alvi]ORF03071.1 hypothetical protein BGH95_03965 [Snodgrassella alvi]